MLQGWAIILIALAYIGFLFAVASYGDRLPRGRVGSRRRPFIYALSLAVYCTSWTFFGSVGLAAKSGLDFLTIYIGAGLMIGAGFPILRRIVHLSKGQNITSIADFIAARYGKSQPLGATVTVIAVIGIVPYIALQLKAISASLTTMLSGSSFGSLIPTDSFIASDLALIVAMALATFSVLFGTRHIDATEHQDGLMLAIATESLVKLVAFILVGGFVTFVMFDGPTDLFSQAHERGDILPLFTRDVAGGKWLAMIFLSLVCILLLPRQFHVSVVENNSLDDVRKAAWLFPLYLIAINVFVVPIAIAGLLRFEPGSVDADMFVLALPMSAGSDLFTIIAFLGGLSAATAMVIVASVALAIMVCNDIVVPLLLRHRAATQAERDDMGTLLLNIRRMAIFGILLLGYAYYHMVGDSAALASIGLLSFAAIAQFSPAFFGGLIWRRATAKGAIAGLIAGFAVWAYTLLLPSFVTAGWIDDSILTNGPFDISLLRPQTLFGMDFDPLTHGVIWSLFANIACYVAGSLTSRPSAIERLQATVFLNTDPVTSVPSFRMWRSTITISDLRETVARYLGEERMERSFAEYTDRHRIVLHPTSEADANLIRFAEHVLASAIGAPSSRLVLSLLMQRRNVNTKSALKLLDDASAAIQYNRDLLQTALDHVRQGIAVFDRDMRLICWNRQFRDILRLPPEFGRVGVPLQEIIRHNAERGAFGKQPVNDVIDDRIRRLVVTHETYHERLVDDEAVIEVRTNAIPDGGIVTTFTDITDQIRAAEELARANETLERRVLDRTQQLTALNDELERARAEAEKANLGKTRFLAAVSHDIVQPLNAARLYVTSLVERTQAPEQDTIARNIDASLEAVEDILGALLDISRLDAGALKPEISAFHLGDLLDSLAVEFRPVAEKKGLSLKVMPCTAAIRTDRRLLRRVLQNLIANAIKYTGRGRVLVGCRRLHNSIRLEVHDSGPGIPLSKQKLIFREFHRLDNNDAGPRGLGLGLSIVERIAAVLDHPVGLTSHTGRGSVFSIDVPIARALPLERVSNPAQRVAAEPLHGTTVLCIDNDEKIRDGMNALLSGWGCNVFLAASRRDALTLLRQHRALVPEIILADYHLDDGTGLDTIGDLRWKLHAELPAVLITADRSPALREEARARNVPILYKPVKPAALRALMAQRRRVHSAAE